MNKEVSIQVKAKYVNQYKKGYPLILKESLSNINHLQDEGVIIKLLDERKHFIAKGYFGKQNKGYGWILSKKENEDLNESFFEKKLSTAFKRIRYGRTRNGQYSRFFRR